MEIQHYCDECGDLAETPGVCPSCVSFELIDRIEGEAAAAPAAAPGVQP